MLGRPLARSTSSPFVRSASAFGSMLADPLAVIFGSMLADPLARSTFSPFVRSASAFGSMLADLLARSSGCSV